MPELLDADANSRISCAEMAEQGAPVQQIPTDPPAEVTPRQASIRPDSPRPTGSVRQESSIPDENLERHQFSDSEVEDPNITTARPGRTTGNGRTIRREPTTGSLTTEQNVSDSSEASSRVRIERPRVRRRVDEDSDDDGTTRASPSSGIQRATLLETKKRGDTGGDNTSGRRAQRVREFDFTSEGEWDQFCNALDEVSEEKRVFLL